MQQSNGGQPQVARHRLLCVVLCGGRSSRMGTDKADLVHSSGKSYLEHAVDRAKQISDDVYLSGYNRAGTTCPTILDPVEFRGPVTGVACAVGRAADYGFAGCLVTPVDMPDLAATHLRKLQNVWLKAPTQIVVASNRGDGQLQPLVAIYPVGLATSLRELAAAEQRSLVRWIANRVHLTVELPAPACRNVNTIAEHNRKV